MDWKYLPRVLCIESTEPNTTKDCYYTWEPLIIENGYKYVTNNIYNRFYILR